MTCLAVSGGLMLGRAFPKHRLCWRKIELGAQWANPCAMMGSPKLSPSGYKTPQGSSSSCIRAKGASPKACKIP